MSYNAKVYKVMIASPSDVNTERAIIREVINEWNVVHAEKRNTILMPIGWETHSTPSMGERPQGILNKQILSNCDLLVGVFWTRIGTSTGKYDSGTVEEIEEHIKANKPTMLYFSSTPAHPDTIDFKQFEKLKEFKEKCKVNGLLENYSEISEFKDKFYRQLQIKLNQDQYFTGDDQRFITDEVEQITFSTLPILSEEAQTLLTEGAKDGFGQILQLSFMSGKSIQTNGKTFTRNATAKEMAFWTSALLELESNDLVEAVGHQRNVFKLTRKGYELAELLSSD
ncbi:hypothetical protein [Leptospira santarosai]|uniref:hypothetical protein n=1 Tax=Leptospira santarosai TaxID=28183 RepID=UPI0002978C55|nr:hypothetical protein [Leptospira santarosai]EKS06777.1 hypothetical protein LEP1GSC071_0270 [Leptospira santarosai str. JET]